MSIATKNGSVIVKNGSIGTECGCCGGGWYCTEKYPCDACVDGTLPQALNVDVTISIGGASQTRNRRFVESSNGSECHGFSHSMTQNPFEVSGVTCSGVSQQLTFQGIISLQFSGPCGSRELIGDQTLPVPQPNEVVVNAFTPTALALYWVIAPSSRTHNPLPGTPSTARSYISAVAYKHIGTGVCYGDVPAISFPILLPFCSGGLNGTITLAVTSAE